MEFYHERWRQETAHRTWKYTLELCNLRSHSVEGIHKEVLVHLTLNNAICWVLADAAEKGSKPGEPALRPVDLRFLEAKRLILAAVPVMALAPADQLPCLYQQLLEDIAHEPILVRPGRNYPRRFDHKARNKGHGVQAKPAKLTCEPVVSYELV